MCHTYWNFFKNVWGGVRACQHVQKMTENTNDNHSSNTNLSEEKTTEKESQGRDSSRLLRFVLFGY